jgi:hypothetical protein
MMQGRRIPTAYTQITRLEKLTSYSESHISYTNNYRISQPIRDTFSPEKCDLNLTCVLCAAGKYYFQTYKYPYSYYTSLS